MTTVPIAQLTTVETARLIPSLPLWVCSFLYNTEHSFLATLRVYGRHYRTMTHKIVEFCPYGVLDYSTVLLVLLCFNALYLCLIS